jgi:hypothetical protein
MNCDMSSQKLQSYVSSEREKKSWKTSRGVQRVEAELAIGKS